MENVEYREIFLNSIPGRKALVLDLGPVVPRGLENHRAIQSFAWFTGWVISVFRSSDYEVLDGSFRTQFPHRYAYPMAIFKNEFLLFGLFLVPSENVSSD
jgi:hypothetical protein